MAHQLQKQRDFQQILWFPCDLERERERERENQKSPLTTRVWNSPGQRWTQDLGHGSTWDSRGTRGTRGVKGLHGIAVEHSAASWHLVALQVQDVTLFSSTASTASTAWSVSSVSSASTASTASTASCTINTSLSVCAWVWECVLILWVCCRLLESHVGTHVSHVQHIVRSLAFLPWRWPGTSLSHGTSTGPESVGDAIHKLQRCLACDSFTRWNKLKHVETLKGGSWEISWKESYGLVESKLPFSWWNSQMIYESCMNHVWMIVFYCPVVFVTARQNAARVGEQSKASRSQITYTRMIWLECVFACRFPTVYPAATQRQFFNWRGSQHVIAIMGGCDFKHGLCDAAAWSLCWEQRALITLTIPHSAFLHQFQKCCKCCSVSCMSWMSRVCRLLTRHTTSHKVTHPRPSLSEPLVSLKSSSLLGSLGCPVSYGSCGSIRLNMFSRLADLIAVQVWLNFDDPSEAFWMTYLWKRWCRDSAFEARCGELVAQRPWTQREKRGEGSLCFC